MRSRIPTIAVVLLLTVSALGRAAAQEPSGQPHHFEKVVLMNEVTDPNELAVAPDGSVFVVERAGPIKMWDAETGEARMVGYIPVRMTIEDGLMGLALDPNFAETNWLYVYYAPANGRPQRLSRFTFDGEQVDPSTEKILLEIDTQLQECCHSAGSLAFGPEGNLFLSTGDNTDPYPLGGSPINETYRFGDAQRTSANTNDLRGKILRITPQPDGTYTIPEGNLFEGDELHRPEIYVMGNRNPYRISVDPATGSVLWGDVGIGNPPSEERGPWGWEEFNVAREPGFYGWPYFVGPNDPYRDFDYRTETPGDFFDPENPVNDSPHNTGARELPPAKPALIWYTYGPSEEFPELGAGGMSAMGGPVYRYDHEASPHALPASYDGAWIIYEWMRNWIKIVRFDEEGGVASIEPFIEGMPFSRPNDIEIGPDGRVYLIEWGESFWGSNPDAKVVRVDYVGETGPSRPAKGEPAAEGASSRVSVVWPPEGGIFQYGKSIPYEVRVDGEDAVTVQAFSGHDTHAHPFEPVHGREGELTVWHRFDHIPDIYYQNEFAEIEARISETERDRVRLRPQQVQAEHTSAREQAERRTYGEHPAEPDFAATALTVLVVDSAGYAAYAPINLSGISSIRLRAKSSSDAAIELRLDGPDGTVLGVAELSSGEPVGAGSVATQRTPLSAAEALSRLPGETRAAYEGWVDVTVPIDDPGGTYELYLVPDARVELDWMYFEGEGVTSRR